MITLTQEAYIVAAQRLPVGKRKGVFATVRPDDMLAHALRAVVAQAPGLDPAEIDDVIVGCAMPEAEQGMNVARIALLLAGLPDAVPGITINRFCASGLQAVADAANRIRLGEAEVMIAAGTESMSAMPAGTSVGSMLIGPSAEDPEVVVGYRVTVVDGDQVTLDGNHPLAGKTLIFACTVAAVRALSLP